MKKQIIFVLIVLTCSIKLNATHLMGADISYQHIQGEQYKFTTKLYRFCSGIPLNNPDFKISCSKSQQNYVLNPTRTQINILKKLCDSFSNQSCEFQNATSGVGVEEHVFEIVIDFNTSPYNAFKAAGCCEIFFSVQQCCRNGTITNISPGNFYSDLMINFCNINQTKRKYNNSPILNNKPIYKTCCNSPLKYNCGATENIDGDSISFDLVAPLSGFNSNENYTGSFSNSIPMTPYCPPNPGTINCRPLPNAKPPRGFYFNRETGDIVVTPTKCDEAAVLVVQISEFRKDTLGKWVKIGHTRRDAQIEIMNCQNNNNPEIEGLNSNYNICEGDSISIWFEAKDENSIDSLKLLFFNANSNAHFTTIDSASNFKKIHFSWKTKIGDGRLNAYHFGLNVEDNSCPFNLETSQGFRVFVNQKPQLKRVYNFQNNQIQFEGLNNFRNRVEWNFYNSNQVLLHNSTKNKDTFTINNDTVWALIQITDSLTGCESEFYDTIIKKRNNKITSDIFSKVSIFPNPSKGEIHISGLSTDIKYDVKDELGRIIVLETNKPKIYLKTGVYFIHFYKNQEIFIQKIVVLK